MTTDFSFLGEQKVVLLPGSMSVLVVAINSSTHQQSSNQLGSVPQKLFLSVCVTQPFGF